MVNGVGNPAADHHTFVKKKFLLKNVNFYNSVPVHEFSIYYIHLNEIKKNI